MRYHTYVIRQQADDESLPYAAELASADAGFDWASKGYDAIDLTQLAEDVTNIIRMTRDLPNIWKAIANGDIDISEMAITPTTNAGRPDATTLIEYLGTDSRGNPWQRFRPTRTESGQSTDAGLTDDPPLFHCLDCNQDIGQRALAVEHVGHRHEALGISRG